jgi:CofD-related protein of GAK system
MRVDSDFARDAALKALAGLNECMRIVRTARLPDPVRVARCRRAPELGPRILFFSGGTALRALSRALKFLTHNSIHLITPFDSGGSSARLRQSFAMLSVGDLRNRLLALADETVLGAPEIYRLFSFRFSSDGNREELDRRLADMVAGSDEMVAAIPSAMRRIIRTHLRMFAERMPAGFDLRGASIGNLVLAGGYLNNDHDIESVIFLFSKLVEVRGAVRPVVTDDLHLAARLTDGSRIVGQHLLAGKEAVAIASPVVDLSLVGDLQSSAPARAEIDAKTSAVITNSDLIVFPMGSFYSSVVANLLPAGVGRAIVAAGCPKIYVPNTGTDPEQLGMSIGESVDRILEFVRRDAGRDAAARAILDCVLVDSSSGAYSTPLDLDRIRSRGIDVVDIAMVGSDERRRIAPDVLAELLASLC